MKGLQKTLARLDTTLATVEKSVEGTGELRSETLKTVEEMNELMKSLRSLVEELQQHPESLLRGARAAEALRRAGRVLGLSLLLSGVRAEALRPRAPVRALGRCPGAVAAEGREAPRGVLGVQRVSVPAWMDRPEITARTGAGEIVPDPLARWGEPITRGIQRVVTENLAALLPGHHLVAAPFPAGQAVDHRVDIAITEGGRQPDGRVLLEARWAILAKDGAVLVQRRSSYRTGAASSAGATVAATSEALGSLSREIAAALRELR